MKHGYFAVFGFVCLAAFALISCEPVNAYAVEIGVDEQTGIYDYLDSGAQNLQQIDFSLDSDEDGNRSIRLKIYGLQKLALSEQFGIYDNMDFSIAPGSVTVSGGGGCGICQKPNDPEYYTVIFHNGSPVLAESSFFRLVVSSSNNSNSFSTPSFGSISNVYGATVSGLKRYDTINCTDSLGYFSDTFSDIAYAGGSMSVYCSFSTSGIPILQPQAVSHFLSSSPTVYRALAGLSENITLPSGSVDSSRPWEYYNNTLLPYMEEEFPGFDEYFIFPDGYFPSEPPPQVPTEIPTLPGYDFDIQPNGTLPADAENTAYDMPDVPVKVVPVPSFDLTMINPAEIIAPFSAGLQAIWALITDILVSFDLLPVVSLCFLVLIITAFLALGVK